MVLNRQEAAARANPAHQRLEAVQQRAAEELPRRPAHRPDLPTRITTGQAEEGAVGHRHEGRGGQERLQPVAEPVRLHGRRGRRAAAGRGRGAAARGRGRAGRGGSSSWTRCWRCWGSRGGAMGDPSDRVLNESQLGDSPNGWALTTLGEIATLQRGNDLLSASGSAAHFQSSGQTGSSATTTHSWLMVLAYWWVGAGV